MLSLWGWEYSPVPTSYHLLGGSRRCGVYCSGQGLFHSRNDGGVGRLDGAKSGMYGALLEKVFWRVVEAFGEVGDVRSTEGGKFGDEPFIHAVSPY